MFRILTIEDTTSIASLIEKKTIPRIKKGNGQLNWPSNWNCYRAIKYSIKTINSETLERLTELSSANKTDEFIAAVSAVHNEYDKTDMVILDLALSESEAEYLRRNGGKDVHGLNRNTRHALTNLTGFKLIDAFRQLQCIVVVTSSSSNPSVETLCIEQGANSFILKPLDSEEMTFLADVFDSGDKLSKHITAKQKADAKKEFPKIDNYLVRIANEILKAIRDVSVNRYGNSLVPFWIAVEKELLSDRSHSNTNLLLMDLRGFSKMVNLASNNPSVVFGLMNFIWSEICEVLNEYKAEVNNFIGDAALVFRGVYDSENHCSLCDTIECALKLCALFEIDGVIRKKLLEDAKRLNTLKSVKDFNELEKLITNPETFGLRIVITAPDSDEAFFGMIGNNGRVQHTIISRFMNMLARAEGIIGVWEKAKRIDVVHGHCFLLWGDHRKEELPKIEDIYFKPYSEYLQGELDSIRDFIEGMNIYRIEKQNDNSTLITKRKGVNQNENMDFCSAKKGT
ncbi:MAG: hypothetical protein LBC73_02170 [Oscillospiraceae bacterium]|nr:hypothetical protein [Oscillospiraceae bacterium]